MAAGLGFKTFTTGEVLTAADTNGYLMQGVLVFASAAARDAAITSPQEGQFAYLKDTNVTTYYTGSAWTNLDTTGMTNPMTTTGDMVYSSSGSTPARLGIGTTGQVVTVASGIPSWATPAASGGMTLLATTTLTGASVTVSSLTGYKQLCLVIRNARITSNGTFACTFNSDSTAKYTWNGLKAHDGVLSSATGAAAATSMTLGYIGDSSTSTNLYGGEINIVAADQTTGMSVRSTGGFNDGTGCTAIFFNARYVNAAVISTFTLNAGASTWAAGTLMTYGVN